MSTTINPYTTTTATTQTASERIAAGRAVENALIQLKYNTFTGPDGKTVNLLAQYELGDLQAARSGVAAQIQALGSQTPPLSAAEIQSRSTALINSFRSGFPVVPKTTTTTTTTAPVGMSSTEKIARMRAMDSQLVQLRYNAFPDNSGATLNLLRSGYTLAQINDKRAPFDAQIRALLTKEPPLTADQIKTEGAKIVSNFRALFGVGAATSTTATTDEAARKAAVDAALAKIRGANSHTIEGETYDFVDMLGAGDVASERAEFEGKINALLNKTPPLTPAQITAEADKIIGEWKETGAMICMMVESMMMMMWMQNMPKPGFGMIGIMGG